MSNVAANQVASSRHPRLNVTDFGRADLWGASDPTVIPRIARTQPKSKAVDAEETTQLKLKNIAMPAGNASAAPTRFHRQTARSLPSVLLTPEIKSFDEYILTSQAKVDTRQLELSVSLRVTFHAERSILANLCRGNGFLACGLRGNWIAFSNTRC